MSSKAPAINVLNRMKYFEYQMGLINRHLGQEGGWDSHHGKCRTFILNVIKVLKPEKVTVLGSGWLLELPLAEIIDEGVKVHLVDIVHPPEVKQQTSTYENLKLSEEDVSGGLAEVVWNKIKGAPLFFRKRGFPEIAIPSYTFDSDPGLIISLNLITQLEILPLRALAKHFRFEENEGYSFRKKIQEQHLNMLMKHRFILISDASERTFLKNGSEEFKETLLVDLPEGKLSDEWTWDFDLKGADFYTRKSLFTVKAIYC